MFEKLKALFFAPKVRTIRIDGCLIQNLGYMVENSNTIEDPWINRVWEKANAKEYRYFENGKEERCRVVSPKGVCVNIREDLRQHKLDLLTMEVLPETFEMVLNNEVTLGTGMHLDSVPRSIAYNPPLKEKAIMLVIGIFVGWILVAPMAGQILK